MTPFNGISLIFFSQFPARRALCLILKHKIRLNDMSVEKAFLHHSWPSHIRSAARAQLHLVGNISAEIYSTPKSFSELLNIDTVLLNELGGE